MSTLHVSALLKRKSPPSATSDLLVNILTYWSISGKHAWAAHPGVPAYTRYIGEVCVRVGNTDQSDQTGLTRTAQESKAKLWSVSLDIFLL